MLRMPTEAEPVVLLQGDCLELLPQIPAGAVDAVVTDPPYGIDLGLFSARRKTVENGSAWRLSGDKDQSAGQSVVDWLMSNKTPAVVFAHPSLPWRGEWQQYLVWDKGPGVGIGGGKGRPWKQTWDLIQTAHIRSFNGQREEGIFKYWVSPNFTGDFDLHPCQKPVELIARLVKKITDPGGLVLDPFAGSGTTALACLMTGRRCLAIEIDAHYHAVARKRIDDYMAAGPLFEAATAQPELFAEESE
jgi:DNA modification methylase